MMGNKCTRCEYYHHEYEQSFCPRQDATLRDLAFMDGGNPDWYYKMIEDCTLNEPVRAPMSWWTKKEILKVCQAGGAKPKTIEHMKKINLDDLRLVILVKMDVQPRGKYSEIWHDAPQYWEHVRHTQMWGIDWDLIDSWNANL